MTETATIPNEAAPRPASTKGRAGGLVKPPKGELTPVFTLLMFFGLLDVLLLLLLPYGLHENTDSPWAQAPRLGFLATSILSALTFGLIAGISAERRNQTQWWFLAGHVGAFLALPLAAFGMAESHPFLARVIVFGSGMLGTLLAIVSCRNAQSDSHPGGGPLLHTLGRVFHASGNIWFGISLLVFMTVVLVWGTWWETWYGMKSVHHVFYGAWWFGLLFLAFLVSLTAATLRKYPWRFDQTGWIATHTALILIVIGSFMTFWGKIEGSLVLEEGARDHEFLVSTQTRLKVEEVRRTRNGQTIRLPIWEAISDFDLNPQKREPGLTYTVEEQGRRLFDVEVEEYYADAVPETVYHDDGTQPRAGVTFAMITPERTSRPATLVARDREDSGFQFAKMITLAIKDGVYPLQMEAMRRAAVPSAGDHGRIVVKKTVGSGDETKQVEVASAPVVLGERPSDIRFAPAPLELDLPIPGTELRVQGRFYYDQFQLLQRNTPADVTPGQPFNPAAHLVITDGEKESRRFALAYLPGFAVSSETEFGEYQIDLDYRPQYPFQPMSLTFVQPREGPMFWVYQGRDRGDRRSGEVVAGEVISIGPMAKVDVRKILSHVRKEFRWNFKGYAEENSAVRISVDGTELEGEREGWLGLDRGGHFVRAEGRDFLIRWAHTSQPLGFQLALHDFRRDFYPGSKQERTFESYLRLVEPKQYPEGVDIKIDMNQPLRYQGWRLFQSRFSTEGGERTILQVNRDPGLTVTYPACGLLGLALVIVFFQKPFLRAAGRRLKQKGMSAEMQVLAAFGVVFLGLLACAPGLLMIALLPEGPMLGVAVILIAAGLVAETMILARPWRRRLEARSAGPTAVTGSAP